MSPRERRWTRALLDGCVPGLEAVDLRAFWPRFEQAAPPHLRLGLALAACVFGLGPLLLGRPPLPLLDPARRDACLQRMVRWPGLGALVDVAKVVGCWALFQDPAVQARVRGR